MWVFGYGSLAWDGWSDRFGCFRRAIAELPGFRRAFVKESVRNWGSKAHPCPTLNLIADASRQCKGIAFELPAQKRDEIIDYLRKREGEGFRLHKAKVRLASGEQVEATVLIYSGKNILHGRSTAELTAMARGAQGEIGKCVDYARNIRSKLAELGIDDPEVNEFCRGLE